MVHQGFGCIKTDSTRMRVGMTNSCCYDTVPSKPVVGRGMVDSQQHICNVTKCGSKRCLTCKHIDERSSFTSNITKNIK